MCVCGDVLLIRRSSEYVYMKKRRFGFGGFVLVCVTQLAKQCCGKFSSIVLAGNLSCHAVPMAGFFLQQCSRRQGETEVPLCYGRLSAISAGVVYVSFHVLEEEKTAILLRRVVLPEVHSHVSLSCHVIFKGEGKRHFVTAGLPFVQCSHRNIILPCRRGEKSAALLRQAFVSGLLVPEVYLAI